MGFFFGGIKSRFGGFGSGAEWFGKVLIGCLWKRNDSSGPGAMCEVRGEHQPGGLLFRKTHKLEI